LEIAREMRDNKSERKGLATLQGLSMRNSVVKGKKMSDIFLAGWNKQTACQRKLILVCPGGVKFE